MTLRLNTVAYPAESAETGPPLVIAHGLFGSARNFNALAKRFAARRPVVAVDMRNHGDSPWDDDVSYGAMAGDLEAVIRDEAGGKAVVLGHSMGGKAVMALALSTPELVSGIVVADIAPVGYGHTHLGFIQAMRGLDLDAVSRRADADAALADAIPDGPTRPFILQNLVIREGTARWRLNLAALEAGIDTLIGWPGAAAFAHASYAGPALFVHGGAASYVKVGHRPGIEALFPQADFHEVPGTGHWLHAEAPDAFFDAVATWLAAL